MTPTADPAGTIATRTAGLLKVRATLSWDRPEDAPKGPLLPALPNGFRYQLAETALPGGAAREVSGTLLALTERDLGAALECFLRAVSVAAAVSDAVLETRAARVASPRATPPDVLGALALDLWVADIPVRFAPSWSVVPAGTVALGAGGAEDEVRAFLRDHPAWKPA